MNATSCAPRHATPRLARWAAAASLAALLWGCAPEPADAPASGAPSAAISAPLLVDRARGVVLVGEGLADSGFGVSSARVGDFNGDGYEDVAVGSPLNNDTRGRVTLYLGSAAGLLDSNIAVRTEDDNNTSLGLSVAAAGDVNCDGFDDLAVGVPYFDTPASNAGQVRVYLGNSAGRLDVAYSVNGTVTNGLFGWSIVAAGNVDGQGCDDLLVGAPGENTNAGNVWLVSGSNAGLTRPNSPRLQGLGTARLGTSLAALGDLDGDGAPEFAAGAPGGLGGLISPVGILDQVIVMRSQAGAPFAATTTLMAPGLGGFFGASIAPLRAWNRMTPGSFAVGAPHGAASQGSVYVYEWTDQHTNPPSAPAFSLTNSVVGGRFGLSVANAGDLNGDGYDELAVASPFAAGAGAVEAGNLGTVSVWRGPVAVNQGPAWVAHGSLSGANLGVSLAGVGDVNADGSDDLLAGAPCDFSSVSACTSPGEARLWFGSPAWPSGASAEWVGAVNQHLGSTAIGLGDTDGDGVGDLLIGGVSEEGEFGRQITSFLRLYRGSASGPPQLFWSYTPTQPTSLLPDAQPLGDANGDGLADFAVASTGIDGASLLIFYGSSQGPAQMPTQTLSVGASVASFAGVGDLDGDLHADLVVVSNDLVAGGLRVFYGSSQGLYEGDAPAAVDVLQPTLKVARAGDVNGDGYDDFLAHASSSLVLYYGDERGPPSAGEPLLVNLDPRQPLHFAGVGDVNGDGLADVVVGEPEASELGRARLFLGPFGINFNVDSAIALSSSGEGFGGAIAPLGDANGDGLADFAVGSDTDASVFWGNPGFGSSTQLFEDVAKRQPPKLAAAGDINGDGLADLLLADTNARDLQDNEGAGRAWLYHGARAPFGTASLSRDLAAADMNKASLSLGDLDGDGFDELVVGSPEVAVNAANAAGRVRVYRGRQGGFEPNPVFSLAGNTVNQRLGASVHVGGDVNGDGYRDLLIGVGLCAATSPCVLVYLGDSELSSVGLSVTLTAPTRVTDDRFGAALASTGDVDSDGFDDILVGAPETKLGASTKKDGRAYLFRGGPSGPYSAPAWSIQGIELGNADERVGLAVALPGDLNGDGHDDAVVSAPDDGVDIMKDGVLRVFYGSPVGLPSAPSASLRGGSAERRLGRALLAVGDVTGDGRPDLLAGFKGAGNEDGVRLYAGSAQGLGGVEQRGFVSERFLPGTSGEFDPSLAALGDSDQDGLAEFAVGLPNQRTNGGDVWVLEGTSLAPIQTLQGSNAFGAQLASGDLNADGALDMVVGATGTAGSGGVNQGSALTVVWGNSADLLAGQTPVGLRRARPLGGSLVANIAPRGRLPEADRLEVGAIASPTWGRLRAKAELEVKPLGVPFNGLGLVSSAQWGEGERAAQAQALLPNQAYRWRVRVRQDPARAVAHDRSPWIYGGLSTLPTERHNATALERRLILDPPNASITEGEPGARFSVRLSAPNPRPVVVTLEPLAPQGALVATPDTLVFEPGQGTTPQNMELAVPEDDVANVSPSNLSAQLITASDDVPWSNRAAPLALSVLDNDAPGVRVSQVAASVPEGGQVALQVSLTSRPLSPVTLRAPALVGVRALWGTGREEVTVEPSDWNAPQELVLSLPDDDVAQAERTLTGRITAQSDDVLYDGVESAPLSVVALNNDEAALVVEPNAVGMIEGGSATFTVQLSARPTGPVFVSLSEPSGELRLDPSSFTTDDTNWDTPRTITATSQDDAIARGARSLPIGISSQWPSLGAVTGGARVEVTDDDEAGVLLLQSDGNTFAVEGDEQGDSFSVRLLSQPTAPVEVNFLLTPLGQAALFDGSGAPTARLTFGTEGWDAPQTVRLVALLDELPEGEQEVVVSYSLASADLGYHSRFGGQLRALVQDSDQPINQPPTLNVAPLGEVFEGDVVALSASATDPEQQPVTITWDFDQDGQVDATGPEVSWSPANGPSTARLSVRASDGSRSAEQVVEVEVINVEPELVEALPTTAFVGVPYVHEVRAVDPGALDELSWTFRATPPGMTIGDCAQTSPRCVLLSWTPAQEGQVTLRLSVRDELSSTQVEKTILVRPDMSQDTDGGGAPDACEEQHNFDPNDAADDAQDEDGDGLSLSQECALGRDPRASGAPLAPNLLSPEDGATIAEVTLVADEANDPDGDAPLRHTFEVGPEGEALVAFPGVALTGTYIANPALAWVEDARYVWRARASDPYADGPWSPPRGFLYSSRNDAPPAPALISPVGGLSLPTPTLVASEVEDPEGEPVSYEFEVFAGDDPTPAQGGEVADAQEGAALWTPPQPLADGPHRWRARAKDEQGLAGPWSPEAQFEVRADLDPPSAPGLLWPLPGAVVPGAQDLALLISEAQDPAQAPLRYRFGAQVNGGQEVEVEGVAPQDGQAGVAWAAFGLELAPGDQVAWWAQAYDPASDRAGALLRADFSVALENQPPSAPVLQAPVDGAQAPTRRPLLTWLNPSDPDGDPLLFGVKLWAEGLPEPSDYTAPEILPAPGLTTSVALLAPDGATSLRWRVWAWDGQNEPVASELGSLRVPSQEPAPLPLAPVILSPGVEPGERLPAADPLALRLRRAAAPQNALWRHEVVLQRADAQDPSLSREVQEDKDILEVQADPQPPGLYLWRARACEGDLCGPWAVSALFSLDAPADPDGEDDPDEDDPVVDVGASPNSGCACELGGASPALGWRAWALALGALCLLGAGLRRR